MKNFLKAWTVIFAVSVCVTAASAEEQYVRPCGETVGIKLYTDGLLVVGVTDVEDVSGNKISSARDSGIRAGDIILSADGHALESNEELSEVAEASGGEVTLTVKRGENTREVSVKPALTAEGPKLGLWVRDSTAGIGTVTYLSSDGSSYAALGHGITDVDTGNILSLKSGNILSCSEISVRKSKKGDIGELNCSFDGENIGSIELNAANGIYGFTNNNASELEEMRVMPIDEIAEGPASIMCNIDGCGVREYAIEIKKVSHMSSADKTLVIEITDEELIEKTGGILQGMSGSPIIRDGQFIGAVTHVFINDPLKGFGIAGELMLQNTEALATQN